MALLVAGVSWVGMFAVDVAFVRAREVAARRGRPEHVGVHRLEGTTRRIRVAR